MLNTVDSMSKVALVAKRLAADHMKLVFILIRVVLAFFIGFPLFKMIISRVSSAAYCSVNLIVVLS